MPKKPPAPEVIEDAKYYTVVQPYPVNVNYEIHEEVLEFCAWIASAMGSSEPFFAIHHKPSARGMAIIEINKTFPSKALLGEHRWSEILRKPGDEEKSRVSQIFHSFYNKGSMLRDDGWKRIDISDSFFSNWKPDNALFTYPYPGTHWCPTPKEDVTNKPLCRPLPVEAKPPPPKPVRQVVGSSQWVSKTSEPSSRTLQTQKQAWHKKNPLPNAWNKPISESKTSAARPNAWGANRTPSASVPSGSGSGSASASAASAPARPPGIPVPMTYADATPSSGTDGCSGASSHDPLSTLEDEMASISFSGSQEAGLYGLPTAAPTDESYIAPWEQVADYNSHDYFKTLENQNLWSEPAPVKSASDEFKPVCPTHGKICKRGICADYKKEERRMKALKQQAEKAEKLGNKQVTRDAKGKSKNNTGNGRRANTSNHDWESVRAKNARDNSKGNGGRSNDGSSSVSVSDSTATSDAAAPSAAPSGAQTVSAAVYEVDVDDEDFNPWD